MPSGKVEGDFVIPDCSVISTVELFSYRENVLSSRGLRCLDGGWKVIEPNGNIMAKASEIPFCDTSIFLLLFFFSIFINFAS